MQVIALDEYIQRIDNLTDNGKLEQAAFHCLYILRQFPKMLSIYEKMGRIYSEMGNVDGALNIYLRLCSVQPENHFYHIPLVYTYMDCKQIKKATEHCLIALSLQSGNQSVTHELSLWMKKNNINSIVQDDISIEFSMGLQAFREKEYFNAIQHFIRSSQNYFYNLSVLFIGLSYYDMGSEEKGILILKEILKSEPYNITALKVLCSYYSRNDKILFSQYLTKLIDLDPYYNHWEIQSKQIRSQHYPIHIIFYEWTGTPKAKMRIGWQQMNEKLIINENRKLPEWLDLLPSASIDHIAKENAALEENYYIKTYFSDNFSNSSNNQQLADITSDKTDDSELEQAFILLKQVAADGYQTVQLTQLPNSACTFRKPESMQEKEMNEKFNIQNNEASLQEREKMRNAWRCFSMNEQEKGILLYKELIEQRVCLGQIKQELQELSILFPDNKDLLDLLQSI